MWHGRKQPVTSTAFQVSLAAHELPATNEVAGALEDSCLSLEHRTAVCAWGISGQGNSWIPKWLVGVFAWNLDGFTKRRCFCISMGPKVYCEAMEWQTHC